MMAFLAFVLLAFLAFAVLAVLAGLAAHFLWDTSPTHDPEPVANKEHDTRQPATQSRSGEVKSA